MMQKGITVTVFDEKTQAIGDAFGSSPQEMAECYAKYGSELFAAMCKGEVDTVADVARMFWDDERFHRFVYISGMLDFFGKYKDSQADAFQMMEEAKKGDDGKAE